MTEKKKKIDFEKVLFYFFLTIFTIIFIIIIYKVQKIKNNFKKYKIIIDIILILTYISVIQIPIKKLIDKSITKKAGPIGEKGIRGSRGNPGDKSICESCTPGDLCYKKIMNNISITYNWWRYYKKKSLKSYSYIISNEYIKSKVKQHCKSKEFSKILNKFGSNNKNTCGNIDPPCGAYDYMFRMWSIWILIILKYEKGDDFLNSEKLNENDFINLLSNETQIDKSWNDMFNNDNVSIKYNHLDDNKMFDVTGINEDFLKYDGIPNITLTPFNEIKKYKAWYWGADENTKPIIEIKSSSAFDTIDTEKLCKSCINDVECPGSNRNEKLNKTIKFKKTNNFYKLFSTINSGSKNEQEIHTPFQPYGNIINTSNSSNNSSSPITNSSSPTNSSSSTNNGIIFMRAHEYIDNDEHIKYRHYRPIGDVVFYVDDVGDFPFSSNTCLPDKLKYNDELKKKLVKYKHLSSILVSGDIKSPTKYELVYTTINNTGLNKGDAFSIWKPKPPKGYISLGYVIDTSSYNNIDELKENEPNLDIIACVPDNTNYFEKIDSDIFKSIWETNKTLDDKIHTSNKNNIDGKLEIKKRNYNIEKENQLNTFITNIESDVGIFKFKNVNCNDNSSDGTCFSNTEYKKDMSNLICEIYNPNIHNKTDNKIYNECSILTPRDGSVAKLAKENCNKNNKCIYLDKQCKYKNDVSNNLKYSIYNIYNL